MGSDDPNFFRDWMDGHRLKASDVCGPLHVSEQTIAQWRSYGVPARRVPHVEEFMAEWVDPAADSPVEDLRVEAFVMRPNEEQFDAWNRAASAAGMTVREWIAETLERAAIVFQETGRLPGDDDPPKIAPFKTSAVAEGDPRYSSPLADE